MAIFLVSTLITASENSVAVMRIKPNGISYLPIRKLTGTFHLRVRTLKTEDQNTEGLHREAPDNSERISFPEKDYVSAAEEDRDGL